MKLLVYILNIFLLVGLIAGHIIGKVTAEDQYPANVVNFAEASYLKPASGQQSKSIYDYSFTSIDGKVVALSSFKGKKILFVNTASECGFTPQYKQLQEVYEKYKSNLVVIGFPANDFGKQEPGSNREIQSFCSKNFKVTFPMSQKVTVLGDNKDPIYKWLTSKELNGKENSEIKWNFQKYLVDEHGKLIKIYKSAIKPDDKAVIDEVGK
jgi:glutathione peroxidase